MSAPIVDHVDFYFDFISPYAYFGWLRIQDVGDRLGVSIAPRPVLFAGLLNHSGQLGPAEIPAMRAWLIRDTHRYAKRHGIAFEGPKYHPFNPLTALRLALAEVGGADQRRIVDAIYRAAWGEGIDPSSPDELRAALDQAGLDGASLLRRVQEPGVKEALKRNTDAAIARGVFGVPTMFVGDELFWGSDRIEDVERALEGRDPIDQEKVREAMQRPKQADRRAAAKV